MGDHPRLPRPTTITKARISNGFDPGAGPVEPNRPGHATTLAGILAGIEGTLRTRNEPDEEPDEGDVEEDSPVVLVIEGRAPLKDGPFRRWGMTVLSEGDRNTYLVLTDREARRLFADLVDEYGDPGGDWSRTESWRTQLDAIKGVELYGRKHREDPGLDDLAFDGVETVDVLLWASSLERPNQRERAATARVGLVTRVIDDAARRDDLIRVVTTDARPDSTLVRVNVDRALLDELLEHPWVEKIRPPLRPTVTDDHLLQAEVPDGDPEAKGAAIGVIDDLIVTAHPLLGPVVQNQNSFPAGAVLNPPTQHGTQVAGIAAYGDFRPYVTNSGSLPAPHPIFGARIMHADPFDRAHAVVADPLHTQLESALEWLASQGVRVAVCAVNFPRADDGLTPTESAAVIDRLARELDMVVVVSAGNVDALDPPHHWMTDYPDYLDADSARVADPGSALLALTVGAVSRFDVPATTTTVAIAHTDQPAPFTRVGPTRGRSSAGTRKPEFEAHGGNFTYERATDATRGGDSNLGVVSLTQQGTRSAFTAVDGTSFAAPYVAHQVAKIATRYPGASANLLRALTALSGRPNRAVERMPINSVVSAYGEPNAASVLESGRDRVIVVYEGELPIGTTAVHRIPVPEQFATGSRGQQVRVALAFDPPVRRTRRVYSTGDMSFNILRAMTEEQVVRLYSRQPTRAQERNGQGTVLELPRDRRRPDLEPGSSFFASNTLISRTMRVVEWSPDDEDYFLVVQHHIRPWARKRELPDKQSYAFAIELSMHAVDEIDLLALVEAQLRVRARARQRG